MFGNKLLLVDLSKYDFFLPIYKRFVSTERDSKACVTESSFTDNSKTKHHNKAKSSGTTPLHSVDNILKNQISTVYFTFRLSEVTSCASQEYTRQL